MLPLPLYSLTLVAMMAFAGNSLLCRLALRDGTLDASSFTLVRLAAGALVLWLLVSLRAGALLKQPAGSWRAAFALFVYALGFSYAYLQLTTATGALLLFAAVQITMIGMGMLRGERMGGLQWLGLGMALTGLVYLLLPGLSAPAPLGASLMLAAGVAWGIYSLQPKSADPLSATAGNFMRSLPLALLLGLVALAQVRTHLNHWTPALGYALASGAITSGLGYAIWYRVLPHWSATQAASIQLSAPLLAALAAIPLLGEPLSLRLLVAGVAILSGIALVIRARA